MTPNTSTEEDESDSSIPWLKIDRKNTLNILLFQGENEKIWMHFITISLTWQNWISGNKQTLSTNRLQFNSNRESNNFHCLVWLQAVNFSQYILLILSHLTPIRIILFTHFRVFFRKETGLKKIITGCNKLYALLETSKI